ncbi:MAG: hypothetical protein JO257_36675 [Deltaproteobacteria bacterium]|nr:hypothetical protein [Deltaproteobacteria bacterium]
MSRVTWALAVTTLGFAASTAWLYTHPRETVTTVTEHAPPAPTAAAHAPDPWTSAARTTTAPARSSSGSAPALPAPAEETRLERRQRRQQEIAALLGRSEGETDDEYKARIVPLIKGGLAIPRSRVEEMRREAEAKAHVTPEQSQKLDRTFDKMYGSVLDYTNKAIADGQLSPYETNVAGMLEYAGGLGAMLQDAQGQIGQVLSADQMRAMTESGFQWGEYLGVEAPWEQLQPPPPPPKAP